MDRYAEDDPTDFISDYGFILRSEGNNLVEADRDARRRAMHDYTFRARAGRQPYKVDYFGSGRYFPTAPIKFAHVFTEEPLFTFGIVAREGVSSAFVGNATALVLRYEQNYQNFYIGAYMAFYVDVRDEFDQPVDSPVKITFNCLFDGISMPVAGS